MGWRGKSGTQGAGLGKSELNKCGVFPRGGTPTAGREQTPPQRGQSPTPTCGPQSRMRGDSLCRKSPALWNTPILGDRGWWCQTEGS